MMFPCTDNDLIVISSSDKKGRCCTAKKLIKKGETITSNKAFCWSVRSNYLETHCSNCLKPSSYLKLCTNCVTVRYCSRECQKNDWKQHKHECKHLRGLLDKFSAADLDEIILLIRTIIVIKGSKEDAAQCEHINGIVKCSKSHVDCLSVPTVCYDESLLAIFGTVCSITKQSMEVVAKLLFQFRSNNFGITNDLMTCIGSGVYPHAAILNHSCTPNCVLRYSLTIDGPILHIVALRDIAEGEELTHSYVDCASPQVMRQATLTENYDFQCDCRMCSIQNNNRNNRNDINSSSDNRRVLKDELARQYNSGIDCDPIRLKRLISSFRLSQGISYDGVIYCDSLMTEIKVTTETFLSTLQQVEDMTLKAQEIDLLDGDSSSSVNQSTTGLELMDSALRLLTPQCGPFNFELYKLRGKLITQFLLAGLSHDAFKQCKHMVSYLVVALCNVPSHPLLGLQLYTLGDIARDVGELRFASEVYEWSKDILIVTHGAGSELVERLECSMNELQLELLNI